MAATTTQGRLTHLVGAMGGDAQPQILLQLLARMLQGGQDPATAVSAPRLALDAPGAGPFRLWSVSYTHLDVYKRQGWATASWPPMAASSTSAVPGSMAPWETAVSYTHL